MSIFLTLLVGPPPLSLSICMCGKMVLLSKHTVYLTACLSELGSSNHVFPIMDLHVYTQLEIDKKSTLRYDKDRYQALTNQLNAEQFWLFLVTKVDDVIRQFTPTSKPSKDRRKKLWMNRETLTIPKRKCKIWKQ